jgi:hypothetical protein
MGQKSVEFKTSLSVKECALRFRSGITDGRGASARIGGMTAKLMGGQSLGFYTPERDDVFSVVDDDPPSFSVGVAVPKAVAAHKNGTNVHMDVRDRGDQREVVLWAHHSLAGGAHAEQLFRAVMAEFDV